MHAGGCGSLFLTVSGMRVMDGHGERGSAEGRPFRIRTPDRLSLGGFLWRHPSSRPDRPVVVIAAATSVRCRYYARFADYLHANGFDVATFDYRGIGESRPASLSGMKGDWVDWGEQDLEAILQHVQRTFPGQPVDVVAHSIGGFAVGAAPSARYVRRIFTVGAQYAYWRDYGADQRLRMVLKWHVLMPAVTRIFGYFPAKRLGWMEDTPAGVVRDWSRMKARFEDTVRQGIFIGGEREAEVIVQRFGKVLAPILAVGLDDDPHGTQAALDRLLDYFTASCRLHLRIDPVETGQEKIGHFAFFHDRFKETLWPTALHWLRNGTLLPDGPGRLVRRAAPCPPGLTRPRAVRLER